MTIVSINDAKMQPAWPIDRAGLLFLAVFLICCVASFSLTAAAAEPAPGGEIKAIQLVQTHYWLGPLKLTLSGDHLRLDSTGRMCFTMVANAPEWNVSVYRNDDKVIKTQTFKQFINSGLVSEMVLTYRPNYLPNGNKPYPFKYHGFDACRVANHTEALEYLPVGGLITRPEQRIMYASYRLSDGCGIGLHFVESNFGSDFITGMDNKGRKEDILATSSIKIISVPKEFFVAPSNYRSAKDMQEITTSSESRAQDADFQNLLDSSEKASPAKGSPVTEAA